MKTCKEIKADMDEAYDALFSKYRKDIGKARQEGFPVGTRVRWSQGLRTCRGRVIGYPDCVGCCDEVAVEKIYGSTKTHRGIKSYRLEKDDVE